LWQNSGVQEQLKLLQGLEGIRWVLYTTWVVTLYEWWSVSGYPGCGQIGETVVTWEVSFGVED